ncbi:MAG: hypothetical protein AB7F43_08550 [Bacteriovoracia bacterium]
MGLLSEIENAATNSSVPIVDLLRKCKVLAARLKHSEFSEWANNELNGYPELDKTPEYRRLRLPSAIGHFSGPFGSALKNAPIPSSCIPDTLREMLTATRMTQSIAEIEDLANAEDGNLLHPWSGDVIAVMQRKQIYQHMVLMEAHSNVSPAMLKGIVDTVRTRVLDYVLAIQAQNPNADSATPSGPAPISAATLHQTFHTTIIGGQANVGGQGSQSISGTNDASVGNVQKNGLNDEVLANLFGSFQDAFAKLGDADKDEASSALARVEAQIKTKKPDLDRIKNYLDIIGKIAGLAPLALKAYERIRILFS